MTSPIVARAENVTLETTDLEWSALLRDAHLRSFIWRAYRDRCSLLASSEPQVSATEEVAEALAALEATTLGWQPIETAPKPETRFEGFDGWLSFGDGKGERIADVYWNDGRWVRWNSDWSDSVGVENKIARLTHWMPVPAAPSETQEGGDPHNPKRADDRRPSSGDDNAQPALGDAVARATMAWSVASGKVYEDDKIAAIAAAITQAVAETWKDAAAIALNPGFIQARDTEWDEGVNYAKRFIHEAIRARGTPEGRP